MEPAAALHDDALAAILDRLPARSLAASRRVCKTWHDLVDDRHGQLLLRLRNLLPHAVSGFFVNYQDHGEPHFFARPTAPETAGPRIDGQFDFIEKERGSWGRVLDHCNGLVLYTDDDLLGDGWFFVCNPVTRRWKRLPRCPGGDDWRWHLHAFLVFCPAVSKHYRVLLVSRWKPKKGVDGARGSMDWPPSRWRCYEFSSRTGRWQERVFVREGEAAGTVADLIMDSLPYSMEPRWRFSAYWQGDLYVHCHGEYVARMSLSDATYRVIKSPIDRTVCYSDVKSFLGRSEKGVYFAAIYKWQLRVWILHTAGSSPYRAEWVLKHNRVLKPDDWYAAADDYHQMKLDGPWILDDYEKRKTRADVDWSSDDDDVIQTVDWYENSNDDEDMYPHTFHVLGFHPYKEVIFLATYGVAVAYHLNSCKVQFLGILSPKEYNHGVTDSFVYTPCISCA